MTPADFFHPYYSSTTGLKCYKSFNIHGSAKPFDYDTLHIYIYDIDTFV